MYETVSQSHQYDQERELLPVTRLAKWLRIEVRLLRNAIEELEIEGVEYEINCKKSSATRLNSSSKSKTIFLRIKFFYQMLLREMLV